MLKIAYILPSLANKGPVLVVKDIAAHLSAKAEIDVFYFDPIQEVQINCNTRQINFFETIDFAKYDIVHSHMLRPDAYVRLNRKKIKGYCVSTLHNYVEQDLAFQYNKVVSVVFTKVWKQLLAKHDLLIALQAHMQAYYKKLYHRSDITYVYNGRKIDTSLLQNTQVEEHEQILNFKAGSILIGVAALLTHRKGIEQLLQLLPKNNNYKLLIIGDGKAKEYLLNLAATLKVTDRCLFLGYRNNAFLYYKYFDVYAMPSRSEGFSLALIEASAFGLPTICSDLPVFKEVFSNDEVAFFKLDNIDDLHTKMQYLLNNSTKFAANFKEKYLAELTEKKMAEQYFQVYKSLLAHEI